MPNKTIYVRDDKLWEKAKKLATKEGEGLSGVISNALTRFVAEAQEKGQSDSTIRLLIIPPAQEGDPQKIAFVGHEIGSTQFPPQDPQYFGGDAVATVYKSVGGKFILTVRMVNESHLFYYSVNDDLDGMAVDPMMMNFYPDVVSDWTQELKLLDAEKAAKEIWID